MGASVSQSGNYRRRAKGRDSARREMRCPRPQSYEFPAGIAVNAGAALRHQRRRVLARARVVFPCQFARFAGLLDSPVAVIPLSDVFDVRPYVLATRGDKEACAIAPDLLVLRGGHLYPLGAAVVCAFANPRAHRDEHSETGIHVLHTLVDIAEEQLVHCRSLFAML